MEEKRKKTGRSRAEIEHDKRYREIRREFKEGRMPLFLHRYLAFCGRIEDDDADEKSMQKGSARAQKRLPNPAGFCRFLGLRRESYRRLEEEFPTEAGRLRAVFEDEALNSDLPASVLGFYLKYLLAVDEEEESNGKNAGGDILVSFAHDILSDGR